MNAPAPSRLGLLATVLWPVAAVFAGYRYFNRKPGRTTPTGAGLVVSPAAGKVIHIERSTTSQVAFFKHDVLQVLDVLHLVPPFHVVVIELTLTDVHVQRAPIHGTVLAVQHFPGRFDDVLHTPGRERMANTNEKALTVIGNDERQACAVIQVAGMVARNIIPYLVPGQAVARGAELGMITFGSQVVLVLPAACALRVAVGDRVTDGETIMATF